MEIRVVVSDLAPVVTLEEADDFTGFKVVVKVSPDLFVDPDQLLALAADRASNTAWRASFGQMVDHARALGWVNGQGQIQAHVELES